MVIRAREKYWHKKWTNNRNIALDFLLIFWIDHIINQVKTFDCWIFFLGGGLGNKNAIQTEIKYLKQKKNEDRVKFIKKTSVRRSVQKQIH